MTKKNNKTLIIILGSTAVGKTKMAIALAKNFGSEIISSDSRQFYKELKIGVATPSKVEQEMVKHHFIGHLSVKDYYNISRFENDVIEFLDQYFIEKNVAIMCGGSGLYIDAIAKGIDYLPDPDETLRKNLKIQLDREGVDLLLEKLKKIDPEYYEIVDKNNPSRILRALEICMPTGQKFSDLRKDQIKKRDFKIIKVGLQLDRKILIEKIHARVDQMLEEGLVEEVKGLLPYKDLNALNTVGYKEIFKYLGGQWTIEYAIEKIKTNTRRYAKRQMTWFRKDEEIEWFSPNDLDEIIQYLSKMIK